MYTKIATMFAEAAQEVLAAEVSLEVTRGEMKLFNAHYQTEDLTVVISMVGGVAGTVLYSLTNAAALNLAECLLGEPQTEVSSLAQSGIAELGNVITGRSIYKLSQAGYETSISPPMLLIGQGTELSTLDLPRLRMALQTEAGVINLHLALREAGRLMGQADKAQK